MSADAVATAVAAVTAASIAAAVSDVVFVVSDWLDCFSFALVVGRFLKTLVCFVVSFVVSFVLVCVVSW